MILAIDIGNSNIVLGCIRDGEILFEARMATDRIKTKDQYCAELKAMLELFRVSPAEIDGCIVSSVVPQIQQSLVEAAERLTGKACLTVGPGLKTGLRIKIDNPAQAGSDLIVGAVASIDAYGTGLCVIDMGTATTICAIDREGAFLGGTGTVNNVTVDLGGGFRQTAGNVEPLKIAGNLAIGANPVFRIDNPAGLSAKSIRAVVFAATGNVTGEENLASATIFLDDVQQNRGAWLVEYSSGRCTVKAHSGTMIVIK